MRRRVVVLAVAAAVAWSALSLLGLASVGRAALLVLGVILLAAAPLIVAADAAARRRTPVRATGTVLACEGEGVEPSGWEYTLTVRFTSADGRDHVVTESGRPRRRPSDPMPVRYDPRDPARARLDLGTAPAWTAAAVVLLTGAVVTWFAAR
ncbi:DUF3592 domain-containing protein [Actinomadura sp. LD22]|uniref:DUF3592 domain-containing protein n=1 Tax=Actinomadura physcomitrii TaxID=2650748 RepID=A0A6I4M889_9ACTN|nr:DUF3592 domain-containing protein [Actinomadura physcomitrii]MWA00605.1 DUF3592 domain-containing protein [Actinomadura physcomitrii]